MFPALPAPEPGALQRLDAEAVATAALVVAGRGELISTTTVHRELGRGSLSTVGKHLKAWAGINMPLLAGKATAPKWTARELEGMNLLRRVFREEATAALAEARRAADDAVAAAKAETEAAREETRLAVAARERADERAKGLEAGMVGLRDQLLAGGRDRDALNDQIVRLQAANAETSAQYERTLSALRKQVDDAVTRYAGMERHMLLEIDRARTEVMQVRERLEGELALISARANRDAAELERVRRLRDEATAKVARLEVELTQAVAGRGEAERRLGVTEAQVTLLAQQTTALATAQNELSTRLVASQQQVETVSVARQRLLSAAAGVLDAVAATPATFVAPAATDTARLGKAIGLLQGAVDGHPS